MGVAFSSLWSSLFGSKELKICILGLDNAGKTTLMYKMTLGSVVSTAPTVGSNTETFEYKNLKFMLWDVGGQTALRTSWSSYLTASDAVIFVLDSNDRSRVQLAKEELHRIANDEQVAKAPILVLANKQDIKGSMSPAEISEALALTAFRERTWQIFGCSALTGKGLTEGLDWLAHTLGAKGFSYDAILSQFGAAASLDTAKADADGGVPSADPVAALSTLSLAPSLSQPAPSTSAGQAHEAQPYDAEMEAHLASLLATNRRTATRFIVEKTTREAAQNWDRFYKHHADKFFKDRHWTTREFGKQIGKDDGDANSHSHSHSQAHAQAQAQPEAEGERERAEGGAMESKAQGAASADAGDRDDDATWVTDAVEGTGEKVLLEVGCGVGNMLYPLVQRDQRLKVHCCDFSARAVELVKADPRFDATRINAFVHDLTQPSTLPPQLSTEATSSWAPITTISMIFVLSAIPPTLHLEVLSSLISLLKSHLARLPASSDPDKKRKGHIILRDYAYGDLSQLRYHLKKDAAWAQPSLLDADKNWYKRGDNTFNYFFTKPELEQLAQQVGMEGEVEMLYRTAVNRKLKEGRQRRFVQAKWTVSLD
ncbi:hypothetical protein ACQY0O_004624 [Thecaphora frezii]